MRGRPRILMHPTLVFEVEVEDYEGLEEMLVEYRRRHPEARLASMLREIIRRAVERGRRRGEMGKGKV